MPPHWRVKFADRGALEKAFVDSFDAFEKVISQLSPDQQREIFGEDAKIFYNAENYGSCQS